MGECARTCGSPARVQIPRVGYSNGWITCDLCVVLDRKGIMLGNTDFLPFGELKGFFSGLSGKGTW